MTKTLLPTDTIEKCGDSYRVKDEHGDHVVYVIYKEKNFWTLKPLGLIEMEESNQIYFDTKDKLLQFLDLISGYYIEGLY